MRILLADLPATRSRTMALASWMLCSACAPDPLPLPTVPNDAAASAPDDAIAVMQADAALRDLSVPDLRIVEDLSLPDLRIPEDLAGTCRSDLDCPLARPRCELAVHECVQCLVEADCGML